MGASSGKAGTMRERRPGSWELRAWDRTARKIRTRTVKAKNPKAAGQLLADFVSEVNKDQVPKAPAKLTLQAVAVEWIEGRNFRTDSSRAQHEWALTHITGSSLGTMPIRGVAVKDLNRFYRSLDSKLAPKSIRHVHGTVRGTLEYARRARYIIQNPCDDLELGAVPSPEYRVEAPTQDEVAAFLRAVDARTTRQWLTIVVLLVTTGIRRAELCGLRWGQVDLDAGTITVGTTTVVYRHPRTVEGNEIAGGKELVNRSKTPRSQRTLSVGPHTLALLAEQRDRIEAARKAIGGKLTPDTYVFSPEPDGSDYYAPATVTRQFIRIRRRAALESGIRPHKFRHFSATMAAMNGIPITEIMGRHGWTNYKTALNYSHFTGARDQQAALAAESVLELPPPEATSS